ncbi:hypothetical protein [Nitrosomonas communis]|uniref:Uncharacterized protein n=1 Tax=Nitrosomonas communis TaxID=44574 RepID=A0A1I4LVW9_9PROT|nr:hypothetical protein [Nitrosomonas communis]SFL95059.1 hypothetical protein SAMN05421863_1007117 [Nitrosomonas communis]
MEYIHTLRTVLALLIVTIAMIIGTGMSISAQAAPGQKTDNSGKSNTAPENQGEAEEQINKIRKEEEQKLKKGKGITEGREQGEENLFYPQQAKSLAERLRESAAIVAQQGGNAQPLLDAAAYYDKEAE